MLVFGKYAMETLWLFFPGTQGAIKAGERACVCSRGRQAGSEVAPRATLGLRATAISELPKRSAAPQPLDHKQQNAAGLLPVALSSCTLRPGAGFGPRCGSRRAAWKGTCPHRLSPLRFGEERKPGLAELCSNVHVQNT